MENFIFYAVKLLQPLVIITEGYLLIIENAFLTAGVMLRQRLYSLYVCDLETPSRVFLKMLLKCF